MPYEEFSHEGPVLVFLHGFPDNLRLWDKQVEFFRGRYHIINFNLPLTSDKRFMRPSTILKTIKEKMRSVPDKKFILIGHDLGGFLLEELGHENPESVEGQILISGMSFPQYAGRKSSLTQIAKSWYVILLQVPGVPHLLGKILHTGMPHLYKTIPEDLPEKRSIKSRIKTLMIFGNRDPFLIPPTHSEASRYYKDVRVEILKGGHWLQRDKAPEVNRIIDQFLHEIRTDMVVAT